MTKKFSCFLLLIIFSLHLQAKNKYSEIITTINFGDKVSEFTVVADNSEYRFKFSNSYGEKKEGKLSKKDYDFIVSKVEETLDEKSNDMSYCYRRNITVRASLSGKPIEKKACIGSPTKVSKKITEVANTLELLLW